MNEPNKVILHVSATRDVGNYVDAELIRQWHLDRGWSDIGYHYVIKRDGTIENGRPTTKYGAHTLGQNRDSIGICLVGTKEFTYEQIQSWKKLAKKMYQDYAIEDDQWYGHYTFANKDCPNICNELIREIVRTSIF